MRYKKKNTLIVGALFIFLVTIYIIFKLSNSDEVTLNIVDNDSIGELLETEGVHIKEIKDIYGETRIVIIANTQKNSKGNPVSYFSIYTIDSGIYAYDKIYVEDMISLEGNYSAYRDEEKHALVIRKKSRALSTVSSDSYNEIVDVNGEKLMLQSVLVEKNHKGLRRLDCIEEKEFELDYAIFNIKFAMNSNYTQGENDNLSIIIRKDIHPLSK